MNQALFSSSSDEWYTPQKLFDYLDMIFDFTLDPCANGINPLKQNIKEFTIDDDGLIQDWSNHVVFCNPPYSQIKKWVAKCYHEYLKGTKICLLIPVRTDTSYFHDYIYNKENIKIDFIRGRLKFSNCKNSAPFPSMLVYFNL